MDSRDASASKKWGKKRMEIMSIKGGGVRRLMENSILNFVSRMTSLSVYILLHCLTRVEFCCAILQSTSGQSTAGKKITLLKHSTAVRILLNLLDKKKEQGTM